MTCAPEVLLHVCGAVAQYDLVACVAMPRACQNDLLAVLYAIVHKRLLLFGGLALYITAGNLGHQHALTASLPARYTVACPFQKDNPFS